MAYASFSVVFGEQPSAAKWNILGTNDASFNDGTGIANLEIGSGHTSVKNDYKFSAYRASTNQTVTGATWTKAQLNAVDFDTGSNYDIVTNFQFTAPVAGYYQFNSGIQFSALSDTSVISIGLNVNAFSSLPTYQGPQIAVGAGAGAAIDAVAMSRLIKLSANDTVQLYGFGNNAFDFTGKVTWLDGLLQSQT